MNKYKVGSNQYKKIKKTNRAIKLSVTAIIIYTALLLLKTTTTYATGAAIDNWLASHEYLLSPPVALQAEILPIAGLIPEKQEKPTKANIVSYIMEVFGKYGTDVGVKAINCFYSESGLRTEAYNYNNNGTEDRGVAQINSIHKMKPEDAHDYKKNIDKAEKIFLSRGKKFAVKNGGAWYGKLCE